jgi:hypothetical protein
LGIKKFFLSKHLFCPWRNSPILKNLQAISYNGVTGDMAASALKSYFRQYQKQAEYVPLSALIPGADMLDSKLP